MAANNNDMSRTIAGVRVAIDNDDFPFLINSLNSNPNILKEKLDGETLLYYAVRQNKVEAVRILLNIKESLVSRKLNPSAEKIPARRATLMSLI